LAVIGKKFDTSFASFCKEIKKQNVLDEVSKEFDVVRSNQSKISNHLTDIEEITKANKPVEVDIKAELQPIKKLITSVQGEFAVIKKAISGIKLDVDIETPLNKAMSDVAKNAGIVNLGQCIDRVHKAVEAIKPQNVDVFAPFGGKPLSVKDGCVRVVQGDGQGEIKLRDGEVVVAELKDKSDMVLAKDGHANVTKKVMSDIVKQLKELVADGKPKIGHH